ncbi:MAG: hypothetical protein KUL86_12615 [Castellaniella sp.]|nr:hypothetical protein [Castellaniella sp.]
MIDARTLLLSEQIHRSNGNHATADLMREAASTITSLRTTLKLARAQIAAERDDLIECHGIGGVIPDSDREGLAGVADLNAVLAQIDEALK